MNTPYQDANAAVIDRWIAEDWEWSKPVDHQTFVQAKNGQWSVVLTPTKPVPHELHRDSSGKVEECKMVLRKYEAQDSKIICSWIKDAKQLYQWSADKIGASH